MRMVAIKDMAIPSCCGECDFCTDNWECILLRKRTDNIVGANAKHSDCPLVDIEPLSDEEKRIFLSAMSKERVICKQIDIDKVDDGSIKKLVPIVNTIECKVKKVLWN